MSEEEAAPSYYANSVQVSSQPFDMRFSFGVNRMRGDNDIENKIVAEVVMSHAHAKTMLPIIAKLLAEYENQYGTIPAPGFEEHGRS